MKIFILIVVVAFVVVTGDVEVTSNNKRLHVENSTDVGKHDLCDCGINSTCKFDNQHQKTCICPKGYEYSEYDGKCKECECGTNSMCSLIKGKKYCSCNIGYDMHHGQCKRCECGTNEYCRWNDVRGKICSCLDGYEYRFGICTACDCGRDGYCKFEKDGNKTCVCRKGYGIYKSYCKDCNCGTPDASCTFDDTGRDCECPTGYKLEKPDIHSKSVCMDIDECLESNACANNTVCRNTPGSYECDCKEGYEPKRHVIIIDNKINACEEIDRCLNKPCERHSDSICVTIHPGKYKCQCKPGYTNVSRTSEHEVSCKDLNGIDIPRDQMKLILGLTLILPFCLSAIIWILLRYFCCKFLKSASDSTPQSISLPDYTTLEEKA